MGKNVKCERKDYTYVKTVWELQFLIYESTCQNLSVMPVNGKNLAFVV
jgi:hypothetical protein